MKLTGKRKNVLDESVYNNKKYAKEQNNKLQ